MCAGKQIFNQISIFAFIFSFAVFGAETTQSMVNVPFGKEVKIFLEKNTQLLSDFSPLKEIVKRNRSAFLYWWWNELHESVEFNQPTSGKVGQGLKDKRMKSLMQYLGENVEVCDRVGQKFKLKDAQDFFGRTIAQRYAVGEKNALADFLEKVVIGNPQGLDGAAYVKKVSNDFEKSLYALPLNEVQIKSCLSLPDIWSAKKVIGLATTFVHKDLARWSFEHGTNDWVDKLPSFIKYAAFNNLDLKNVLIEEGIINLDISKCLDEFVGWLEYEGNIKKLHEKLGEEKFKEVRSTLLNSVRNLSNVTEKEDAYNLLAYKMKEFICKNAFVGVLANFQKKRKEEVRKKFKAEKE